MKFGLEVYWHAAIERVRVLRHWVSELDWEYLIYLFFSYCSWRHHYIVILINEAFQLYANEMSVSSNISDEYQGNTLCTNDVSVLGLWTAKHYMLSLVSHAVIFVWSYCRHMCHVSQKLSASVWTKYTKKIFMLPTFFGQQLLWARIYMST